MAKLVAVRRETHSQKVWRRPANYQFAAKEPLAPVVLAELVHVGSWMPIVFVEQKGRYTAMAMMCPVPKHNLFVALDGQWLGGYVPSWLRSYPFRLVRPPDSEQMALCVDEDSGLLADADEKGENFFTADGKPSQSVSKLMKFLHKIEGNRTATDLALASLAEVGVIEPWPLEAEIDRKRSAIKGLHRVKEAALSGLADNAFLKLRKTGALRLAYAQLMSMAQIARFDQLARLRHQLAQTPKIKPEELFRTAPTDLIKFD